jgi:CHAT domain-containing protein
VQPSPSWRALHDLLVRPIEALLPRAPGSRLTIFPHGPLSQLSFAALQDARGQYLIERYTIHYAPAAGALRFTSQSQRRAADAAAHYVLVADPAAMPSAPRGPLRALPGSRREVGTIAAMLPRESVSVLTGGDAREAAVRARLADATVIHFATHGIVRNDQPLESFLALGRTGDETPADGRLTAAEIYDLDLHADVVVLSACRSALGTVSGDGVLGLTRAFFYAGAASIVATMWDVADDPTRRLVPDFYRRRAAGAGKAEALREAQLRLLRDLRAGRVKLGTGDDAVILPENPFFWAAFVLTGEP